MNPLTYVEDVPRALMSDGDVRLPGREPDLAAIAAATGAQP
jgi:hypothetical protein